MVLQETITRERQRDLAKITETLDAIVAEFGYDYVYPYARLEATGVSKCMYVENVDPEIFDVVDPDDIENMKPSCIIGQLAVRLGVDLKDLILVNEEAYAEISYFNFIPHARFFREELIELQRRQDKGMTWGKAVKLFKQETREKVAA